MHIPFKYIYIISMLVYMNKDAVVAYEQRNIKKSHTLRCSKKDN